MALFYKFYGSQFSTRLPLGTRGRYLVVMFSMGFPDLLVASARKKKKNPAFFAQIPHFLVPNLMDFCRKYLKTFLQKSHFEKFHENFVKFCIFSINFIIFCTDFNGFFFFCERRRQANLENPLKI